MHFFITWANSATLPSLPLAGSALARPVAEERCRWRPPQSTRLLHGVGGWEMLKTRGSRCNAKTGACTLPCLRLTLPIGSLPPLGPPPAHLLGPLQLGPSLQIGPSAVVDMTQRPLIGVQDIPL